MSLGDLIIRLCNRGFGTVESVYRFFGRPEVGTISTSDLHSVLNSDGMRPVLVDVRSEAEQNVSRIPGAITRQEFEAGGGASDGQQVVAYCTVGGRSYLYAQKLVNAGVDAANYRDGILGWCRAELPLESPRKQPTNAVHPYWRIFKVPDQYEVKT